MTNVKNILVPIDFSEESKVGLNTAYEMAKLFNSKIHLLHFFTPKSTKIPLHPMNTAVLSPSSIQNAMHQEQVLHEKKFLQKELNKLMEQKIKQEFQGTSNVYIGTLPESFDDIIKNINIDLVVSGTSGSRSLFEYLGGNHTEKMIRKAEVPVMAVSSDEKINIANILVATDLSRAIPKKIFNLCNILEKRGATIHLANIITSELLTKEEVNDRLHMLAKSVGLENYQLHVEHSDNETKGILQIAQKANAGLILMKTYKKSDIWTFLTGSLAEKTARKADIPVVVEKVNKG